MKTSFKLKPLLLSVTALAMILGLGVQQALAAPTYCSADSPTTTNSPNTQSTSDLTFNGANATDCYGLVDANDSLSAINGLNWGNDWTLLDKTDAVGAVFQSLTFTLTSVVTNASLGNGSWLLTVSDAAGGLNLPLYMDLVFALKAANSYSAYFFDGVLIDGSDAGTYHVSWTNKNGAFHALSHMSLYGRADADGRVPPSQIPEPGVLLLLGAGLMGLGLARRRKSA